MLNQRSNCISISATIFLVRLSYCYCCCLWTILLFFFCVKVDKIDWVFLLPERCSSACCSLYRISEMFVKISLLQLKLNSNRTPHSSCFFFNTPLSHVNVDFTGLSLILIFIYPLQCLRYSCCHPFECLANKIEPKIPSFYFFYLFWFFVYMHEH